MRELKGKVAVVTGAASGIGYALAERFCTEGMKVVLADVEEQRLGEAAEALAKTGASVLAVKTDVAQAAAVEALAARALEAFGAAHVLCNNAGVAVGGLSWERSLADWEWIMGVNLWGVIHGIRAFMPILQRQGEGHIVNTASVAGVMTGPGLGAYCATKHAVVALSECLHHELSMVNAQRGAGGNTGAGGGPIGVSVLCPWWVKTQIADSERNRPDHLREAARQPGRHERTLDQAVRAALATGLPPAEVAEHTVRAIQERRFYIFTHQAIKAAFRRRFDALLDEKNPTYDPNFG
ncbi:MAG TPA: SDR family NAD(P)-dependent oxidoreductase [Polyangia bacterium]|jgi:NAD(P)-dependent dehydrogenase (short-subunit alcohol dehydrogenase family)|nr:SDR family NAD(P)-dependent oxidoreductase [Polyangia bacterium]